MTHLCVLSDVDKVYLMGEVEVRALRKVSLAIDRGEFVAVMGSSGSGKSTLLNILGCLDLPTNGRYLIDGVDVTEYDDDRLSRIRNRLVGFVFQSFFLLPYATVLENVMLPSIYAQESGEHRERALEILRTLGLAERARFRPSQLSGGQQQRVAIARALMNDPALILADEPTGQLDSKTSAEIMHVLSMLNERGITIVMVTHDEKVSSFARRIIQIVDGAIV
ncbi:MAG: ABC transporter ATP-binding protein [Thermodesulfovibrionales bacterium]